MKRAMFCKGIRTSGLWVGAAVGVAAAALVFVGAAKPGSEVAGADQGKVKPALFQDFTGGWNKNISDDKLWKLNGIWVATGKNTFDPANITFADTYPGEKDKGFASFTSKANVKNGAEMQTNPEGPLYHYGYYEVRMKLTPVGDAAKNTGVCASFFWKKDKYGRGEWDIEFLSNGKWINTDHGEVTMNCHMDNGKSKVHHQELAFNPSKAFHRYGFLWQPGELDWTVDGKIVYTVKDPGVASDAGYIMMNSWTGSKNWGGLPPAKDAVTVYDWVKFWPGVTAVPDGGRD